MEQEKPLFNILDGTEPFEEGNVLYPKQADGSIRSNPHVPQRLFGKGCTQDWV